MLLAVLIAVAALITLLAVYNLWFKRRHLPPGPTPWPVVGNSLQIIASGAGEEAFIAWRKKYGDVYTYWQGEEPIVAVCGYDKIFETFKKDGDAYAGRPPFPLIDQILGKERGGVVLTEGELWRDQRRFVLHTLRDFGVGKNLMEEKILDEVAALIEKINRKLDENAGDFNLPQLFGLAVGSIINSLIFGYRFDEARELEFFALRKTMDTFNARFMHPYSAISMLCPPLFSRIPPFKSHLELLGNDMRTFWDFFGKQIEDRLEHFDPASDEAPKDVADAFLREKAMRDKDGATHYYTLSQLKGLSGDIWTAGLDSTSNILAWTVCFLVNWPDKQALLHKELDRVIGSNRLVTVADKIHLPFTNAVLLETLRFCNPLPQNLLHRTTKDVVIDGHRILKGTAITSQISVVLYDEKIFPNPKTFNPERFIDEEGKIKRADEVIVFGVGKRQCLGESLARMELFLFIANLFNQFKISAGSTPPSLERKPGFAVACRPYTVVAEKRYL